MVSSNEERVIEKLSALERDVIYLKERDAQLNGSIHRVEALVNKLYIAGFGILGGIIATFIAVVGK